MSVDPGPLAPQPKLLESGAPTCEFRGRQKTQLFDGPLDSFGDHRNLRTNSRTPSSIRRAAPGSTSSGVVQFPCAAWLLSLPHASTSPKTTLSYAPPL